jgi:hypothetical protein
VSQWILAAAGFQALKKKRFGFCVISFIRVSVSLVGLGVRGCFKRKKKKEKERS